MQAMDPLGRDGEVASGVDVQTNATIVAPSVSFFADLGDLKHDDVAIRFKYFPPEFTNDELLALNRLPPPVGSLVKEGRKKLHDINVVNNSTPADGLLSVRFRGSGWVCACGHHLCACMCVWMIHRREVAMSCSWSTWRSTLSSLAPPGWPPVSSPTQKVRPYSHSVASVMWWSFRTVLAHRSRNCKHPPGMPAPEVEPTHRDDFVAVFDAVYCRPLMA